MRKVWASMRLEIGRFVLVATAARVWKVKYLRPNARLVHLSLGPLQMSVWRWPSDMAHARPDPHRVNVVHPTSAQPN